jgi:prevent-host-death family protein
MLLFAPGQSKAHDAHRNNNQASTQVLPRLCAIDAKRALKASLPKGAYSLPEQAIQVRTMSLTKARVSFSQCVNQVCFGSERIVVTSYGEPKAAIVPIEDLRRLQELDQVRADKAQQVPVSGSPGKSAES